MRRTLVVATSIGGATIGVLLLSSFYPYLFARKTWDADALRVTKVTAEGVTKLGENGVEVSTGVTFSVDIENTTERDVTLPQGTLINEQRRQSRALHGSSLKLTEDALLPRHRNTRVFLDADALCAPNYPAHVCFEDHFKDDDNVVLFDQRNAYTVVIPIPTRSGRSWHDASSPLWGFDAPGR